MSISSYYRSKIFLKAVSGIVIISIVIVLAISNLVLPIIDHSIEKLEEKNTKEILHRVVSMVNQRYKDLEKYKTDALIEHQNVLKDTTDVVYTLIENRYKEYLLAKDNPKVQQEIKDRIIDVVKNLRYKESGYFWINDYRPTMIMHPFKSSLDGKYLGDFKDPNGVYLFNEMVKVIKKDGSGFVKYYWPKPGEDKPQPKISFVKAFPQWQWIIGTGSYIDDIDKEIQIKKDILLSELTNMIKTTKIGKSGYMFIYDQEGKIIFHPNQYMMNKNMHNLINPITHQSFYDFFTNASKTKSKKVTYKWDKPQDIGNYIYFKTAWTQYIPELGLYVNASVYQDEVKETSTYIMDLIHKYAILVLIIVILIGFLFLRKIILPIVELSILSSKVKNGDYSVRSSIQRDDELGLLANSFNDMIGEVDEKYKELERTTNQLIQSEKMVALGGMVAGVAHEINTPVGMALTGITHLQDETDTLKKLYEAEDMSQEEFEEYLEDSIQIHQSINVNLNKAANLIKSFKQVAVDQSSDEDRKFNFKEYVEEILTSIHNETKKTNHQIIVNIDKSIEIYSNPGSFSQIITNFVMNSIIHGLKDVGNGIIEISATKDQNKLILIYKDNGSGLTDEVKKKIFDPFYTTNRKNGGSGLGMNIVYNLITQKLHGTIDIKSEMNQGVEFIVTIPLQKVQ